MGVRMMNVSVSLSLSVSLSMSKSVLEMLVCVVDVNVDVAVYARGSSTCIDIHPATVEGWIEWACGWM